MNAGRGKKTDQTPATTSRFQIKHKLALGQNAVASATPLLDAEHQAAEGKSKPVVAARVLSTPNVSAPGVPNHGVSSKSKKVTHENPDNGWIRGHSLALDRAKGSIVKLKLACDKAQPYIDEKAGETNTKAKDWRKKLMQSQRELILLLNAQPVNERNTADLKKYTGDLKKNLKASKEAEDNFVKALDSGIAKREEILARHRAKKAEEAALVRDDVAIEIDDAEPTSPKGNGPGLTVSTGGDDTFDDAGVIYANQDQQASPQTAIKKEASPQSADYALSSPTPSEAEEIAKERAEAAARDAEPTSPIKKPARVPSPESPTGTYTSLNTRLLASPTADAEAESPTSKTDALHPARATKPFMAFTPETSAAAAELLKRGNSKATVLRAASSRPQQPLPKMTLGMGSAGPEYVVVYPTAPAPSNTTAKAVHVEEPGCCKRLFWCCFQTNPAPQSQPAATNSTTAETRAASQPIDPTKMAGYGR